VTESSGADSADALLEEELEGRRVSEVVKELAGKIGENIAVQKVKRVGGAFGYYFHHDAKQGAAVELEGVEGEEARELGKDLAMHVVFAKPKYLTREEVSQKEIDKEKAIITERLKTDPKNAKKPAEILDKIATGQINKFFGQICLMDQPYYRPEVKKTVAQVLREKKAGVKIKRFEHFLIGVA
jgi:elongation factor Ts